MNFTKRTKLTIGLLALLALLVSIGQVARADVELTPEGLAAKYPGGSIQTEESAEQALREVDQQRAAVEQKFATQQHDCYSRFFATKCLDAAKEERRISLAQIRKVEVDANSYIRAARVVERDRNMAEKRAREASNPPKPLSEAASKQNGSQSAPHDPNEGERRVAEHEAKMKTQQQNDAAKVDERAAKAEAHKKKVADSEQRQRDVAQKKAEKQAEAEKKAAKAKAQQDASAAKGQAPASASASSSASAGKP
jgi:hypothetical protein